MLFRLHILAIKSKKPLKLTQKLAELWKKSTDHDLSNKYIPTQKLTAENFPARSKQANLAIKADIDDFVEETDFDDKLKI